MYRLRYTSRNGGEAESACCRLSRQRDSSGSWSNMRTVLVRNADRMMTSANPTKDGIHLTFADGRRGMTPFADLPEIEDLSNLQSIELPNPYAVMLRNRQGGTVEIAWDFA